jgi:hypothetical protein
VDVVPPGVIVEGLKAQVRPAVAEQLNEIGLLNPPTALAPTVRTTELPGVTDRLEEERFREKFWLVTAAAGIRLANTVFVPPAVKYRVPGSPEEPPPPNTISHKLGFTSAVPEELVT